MMKRITFLFALMWSVVLIAQTPDFSQGTFIFNEGAFGSDPASLNFVDEDFDFHENVYQSVNGARFGNTGSFATIFADKLFVISKQANATEGGVLVVADAQTLEELANFDDIDGADGRSFVGVNKNKAYIGTDQGIYTFDIANLSVGDKIPGTGGIPTIDGQVGNMARTSKYVFALQQTQGILVIDPITDEVIETISGYYNSLTIAKDGSVWAIDDDTLYRIDPLSFDATSFDIPTTHYLDPWAAWNAGTLTASIDDNVLYWMEGEIWSLGQKIIKFDIDAESFNEDFALTPGEGTQEGYGAALRVNPHTNDLVLLTVGANFNFSTNWIHYLDADGNVLETVEPDDYNWFPTLAFFPDTEAPQVSDELVGEITLEVDEELIIDLKDKISDADNNSLVIVKTLTANSNEAAVEAFINEEDQLIINRLNEGEAELEIEFDSNGKTITHTIVVQMADEEATLSEEDVVFFVGEGDQTAYVLIDFRDDTQDASFAWGIRFDEGNDTSVLNALEMLQDEDTQFTFDQTGGFLNDIIYNHHEGLAGMPDWWSTWSGESPEDLAMNMGISEVLQDGNWYGFSYGFTPSPEQPRFIYAAYNADWLSFDEVESWFGEGENEVIVTIDFVQDENAEEVTFAWGLKFEEEEISAKAALEILADADENLEITFNDVDEVVSISYMDLERSSGTPSSWKAFIGNNMSDYQQAIGVLETLTDGKLFGLSFGGELVRRPFIPIIIENEGMSVDDFTFAPQIKLWPNPTVDVLHIEASSAIQQVIIFDMQGRVVIQSTETKLELSHLSAGNYLVQIQTEQNSVTKQIVKK